MSIDFSKAPKGATHYWVSDTGLLWYRTAENWPEVYNRGTDKWGPSGHRTLDIPQIKPIPEAFEPLVSVEDAVNSPTHYNTGSVECIDAINASMSQEAYRGYLKGNVLKYLWRFEKKANPVEDLKKARWYLDRLIAQQEASDD